MMMSATKSIKNDYTLVEPGDEIVISGIAGRFPDSDNLEEFKQNLLNKVDLISDDNRRWFTDHPEIPQRTGKVNGISKFDAAFFDVNFKQAHLMDPMCRILMEHAYEAIIDAGINPKQLRGTRTGVIIAMCISETEKNLFHEKLQIKEPAIIGCYRAALANRISFFLGITGPSFTIDTACSSSMTALQQAYRNIHDGLCDDAIVGTANLCLHSLMSLHYSRLGALSHDGSCKTFDAAANGYVRSEAIAAVYLQKAKHAKRIYATIVHTNVNCDGYKEEGITFPSSTTQSKLLQKCYEDCRISPSNVSYIECHGTGTKVGDLGEVNGIDKIFGKNRITPLKIGSVKSNMGHSEPSSGLCQISKMIIAMETGIIPPNLHYKRPRKDIKALEEDRFKVVTEPTPWEGGYIGINSFGMGGSNCHVILKSNPKNKINNGAPADNLSRLVAVSGRTEEAVQVLLNSIEKYAVDKEYIRLLHDIHSENIHGHHYRGYIIVGSKTMEKPVREVQNYTEKTRPIWFLFSGIGSQWPGMGVELMKFPVFAKAMQKCDVVLRPRGIDIFNVLTNTDKSIFDNILHCFVGIAAVQIGLVDLLTSIGIVPDNIIGYSSGELGCAYADGCLTAEQMILSAYSIGLASNETKIINGSMAAVDLGNEDIKAVCPPDIEVAYRNSSDSSTISGSAESIKQFTQLQAKKISAKEVPCSNVFYHDSYIASAGAKLLAYLNEVIPQSKPRSPKWISTSVPRNKWSTVSALLSSAEYHTNNFLNPVLFEETILMIPKDAVTIEIAPHGLLQTILRQSLDPNVTNISLSHCGHKYNVEFVLQAIGKLYNAGLQPNIANLYPSVEFPVSRGTPMISPSIRWQHSDDWYVSKENEYTKNTSGERDIIISLKTDYEYISGHVIDRKILMPAMGYLVMTWETVASLHQLPYSNLSVVFEDVTFIRATYIPKEGEAFLKVMVQKGSGKFEITEGSSTVVSGLIRVTSNPSQEKIPADLFPPDDDEEEVMTTKDIYKELKLRGYQYTGAFRALKSASISGKKGHVSWMGNWVTFLDNMLQIMILGMDVKSLYVPTNIQKIVIDTKLHYQEIQERNSQNMHIPIRFYQEWNTIISTGVEICGVRATVIPRRMLAGDPVLEEYKFVAHVDGAQISLQEAIRLSTHIALEYHQTIHMKTIEFIDDSDNVTRQELISPILTKVLGDLPLIQANILLVTPTNKININELPPNVNTIDTKELPKEDNALLVIGTGLLTQSKSGVLQQLLSKLKDFGFILTRERLSKIENLSASLSKYGLDVILEKCTGKESIILLKKKNLLIRKTEVIHVNNNEFAWLEELNSIMNIQNQNTDNMRIILVGAGDCGLLGFVNCLRKEPGGEIIRGVLIQDEKAPVFSLQNPLYSEQLQLDLPINVLRPGKVWGSYRHQLLSGLKPKFVHHAYVYQKIRGDLSSLRWIEGSIHPENQEDFVQVVYASVNFKDVMLTTGKLTLDTSMLRYVNRDYSIGLEFVGIDNFGCRIMGLHNNRTMSNIIIPNRLICWNVPDEWSLENAATVPCVYATCYCALYLCGNIKRGDKVLIHAGTGGVGQAAIHLALHEGCEVFTTVGTPEKRKFIREMFPSINDDHIGNSRDTSFEQLILQQTGGAGVDIVLNSLAEEKLQASVRCLAKGGRFLEIGKFDLVANNPLGMLIFMKEASFHVIVLDDLYQDHPDVIIRLNRLMTEGLKNGAVKPLVYKIFEKDEIEAALRYMAAGKHIGKVIIKVCDEKETGKIGHILAEPRFYCDSKKSYIILGGLGGFGLELADWLILRGAKNLILTSRTGVKNGYQQRKIDLWKSCGVNVLIITGAYASNRNDCEFILKSAEMQGSVDAIFNLAVVLKDCICKNQTSQSFGESFEAKAWATKMLDELSRKLCPQLRYFVVFSSVSCGRGNAGQTNYGMANSVMERICEQRVADGLPGLAIQWGAIGDVGLVAEWQEDNKELVIGGTLQQGITSCLEKLEEFLLQNHPVVSSMVVAEKRADDACNIIETVANIISLKNFKSVTPHTPLAQLGMDSMMAVELKQTLERNFDVVLTSQDIRRLNFAKLLEIQNKNENEGKNQRNPEQTTAELAGIQLLFQIVDNEDLVSDVCMELQTKKDQRHVEVFLIPGIGGCGKVFSPLESKIKPAATCLQYGINNIGYAYTSIPEYADYLLPYILPKVKERRTFVIVGYSYGSLFAIELVRRLEQHGLNGRLVLIDGAPELIKTMIEQLIPSTTQEELQNNILLTVIHSFQPAAAGKMLLDFEKCTNWEQKMERLVSHFSSTLTSSSVEIQKLCEFCTSFYNHVLAFQKYDISSITQIRASIKLLKPTQQVVHIVEEDYGLHKITKGKVKVHYIEGNHVTILDSDKVVDTINEETLEDSKTIKQFEIDDRSFEFENKG